MKTSRMLITILVATLLHAKGAIVIDMIPVAAPGNQADTRWNQAGFDSLEYEFRIGKYEITAAQYAACLSVSRGFQNHLSSL